MNTASLRLDRASRPGHKRSRATGAEGREVGLQREGTGSCRTEAEGGGREAQQEAVTQASTLEVMGLELGRGWWTRGAREETGGGCGPELGRLGREQK